MFLRLILWIFSISIVTGLLYAYDKWAAVKNRRRVPEKTLLGFCLLGGWPGGLFAGNWLRHKTVKRSYRIPFWICVGLNVVAMALLLLKS